MKTENTSQSSAARRYGYLLVGWSVLVGGSLLWAMHQETRNILGIADAAARANISKDLGFRRWATSHGGVYVPPTEHTPPNPYLKVPDRDVVTTKGKILTLMNPAYMLRELQTDFPGEYGNKSHITSLKLLNPKNAPDAWETGALRAFEQGEKERVEIQQIDGHPYLRMMRPLIAEAGCLKCHGFQGYKVGEIRGGLSTAVALTPYLERARELKISLALTHGAIWLIGLAGLGFSFRSDRRQTAEREKSANELRESEQMSSAISAAVLDALIMVDDSSALVYWNPAAERILGYRADEVLGKPLHRLLTPQRYQSSAIQGFNSFHTTGQGPVIGKTIEIEALHKDGHEIPVELSISALSLNGRWHAVGILRDISEYKRAESSRAQLAAIVEFSNDAIIGKTTGGIITSWNKGAERVYGYSADEIIGKPITTLAPPALHAEINGLLKKVSEGEIVINHESERIRKDGVRISVALTLSPIRDGAGNITGISTIARDITGRKRAEENLRLMNERYTLSTRAARQGVWDWNLQKNELVWDDRMYELYGVKREDFAGAYEAWLQGIHPDDRAASDEISKQAQRGEREYDTEFRVVWPDGSIHYLKAYGQFVRDADGNPVRMTGVNYDITELKVAENKVTELNRDLERRVEERTAQLEAANKELEAFSYSVSHDLRAPLRAIDGFSRILLDGYADKLDNEGKRLINVVRSNTQRMGQLIDDILKFSRTGRVELTSSEIDMEQMAHAVFEELQSSGSGNLQLEIEHIPTTHGDRAMLRQVFVNLLSNAIKFSRTRAVPKIRVGATLKDGETVYFVKDNGVGFDMQLADKLFGVFQRLHSMNEFEGTGIGLAIVKRIVTRHGGKVWAEGKVNEGATIYFALPRFAPEEVVHEN